MTKHLSRSKFSLAVSAALMFAASVVQAEEFIPSLSAHAKPAPYDVMPLYDLNQPGGEMPLVQAQADQPQGAIDTVVNSTSRKTLIGTSYSSATHGHETFADVRAKGSKLYGRAVVVDESAGSYDGASGEEVRFGYDRQAGQLLLGATPRKSTDIKLIYLRDIIKDNKVPEASAVSYSSGSLAVAEGYGLDPVDTDRQVTKLMWDENINGSAIKNMHVEAYSIRLDRKADNYTLRNDTEEQKRQRTKVERTMSGLKLGTNLDVSEAEIDLALDYNRIEHDAKRYGGPTTAGLDSISAYQYPGVEMDEWLLSATAEYPLTGRQQITFGINYKYVEADATKAELATDTPSAGSMSAFDLYQTYYGDVDLSQKEGHFSGKLEWSFTDQTDLSAYASIANVFRSPDSQERYFAATSYMGVSASAMGTSARAVGNPEIGWEQHRRFEAGVGTSSQNWVEYGRSRGRDLAWRINTRFYYDDIKDFITRDRATGQTVTGVSDYARIWRNVDATMSGFEIDAKTNLTKRVASRLVLDITRGENTSDDRSLYYIAPFEANLFLDYFDYLNTGGTWNIGAQIRYVADQDSIDADPTSGSGYDGGETDDFTVVNLYASAQLSDRYGIKIGVNNLTDESYFDSMAKYPLEGNRVLSEAPERSIYVAVVANF
ncbi:hypothetical protein CSW98_06670 [Vibrio sp. HA2012]|uniref:TonB-dependent receptor domain-containing protein n=1 Tax=Vibrio sp. HA2012 TaxID=1971595 RepID=UPI000C2B65D2|nr:TonB-dependent receptor [Vibrio sp. HA2012]PJC86671.1 hypothetical protein CSW98_06670 [Vibrio sp. HA2012]